MLSGQDLDLAATCLGLDPELVDKAAICICGFKICPACSIAKPLSHYRGMPRTGDKCQTYTAPRASASSPASSSTGPRRSGTSADASLASPDAKFARNCRVARQNTPQSRRNCRSEARWLGLPLGTALGVARPGELKPELDATPQRPRSLKCGRGAVERLNLSQRGSAHAKRQGTGRVKADARCHRAR